MDEMDHLRGIRPEPPAPSQHTVLAGLDFLTDGDSEPSGRRLGGRLRRPSMGLLRTATVGGLGVSLAAGLFVSQTVSLGDGDTGGGGPPASAHAAMVLNKAAATAEKEPHIGHAGDFAYVEWVSKEAPVGEHARLHQKGHRLHVTVWRSLDGSKEGLRRSRTTPPESKPGVGNTPPLDQDPIQPNSDPDLYTSWPTHKYLHSLPRDPDAMLAKVREECRKNWETGNVVRDRCRPGDAFAVIGTVLVKYVVPPEVRGTLFEAAAQIGGMTVVEKVTLPTGKRGVAVSHTEDGHRVELVFEPTTYELLGSRTVVTDPQFEDSGLEPGDVLSSTTILEKGFVDQVGERP